MGLSLSILYFFMAFLASCEKLQVRVYHFPDKIGEIGFIRPPQLLFRLCRVTYEQVHFRGSEETGIHLDVVLIVEPDV